MNVDATAASKDRDHAVLLRTVLLPLAALLLALSGQWLLLARENQYLAAALCFIAAINLYLLTLVGRPESALTPQPLPATGLVMRPIIPSREWRSVVVINAVILTLAAFSRFAGNALDKGFWLWVGAILLFLLAFAHLPDGNWRDWLVQLRLYWNGLDKRVMVLLAAVIVVAIFFRFYRLQGVPLEMTSDHAEKILDVQDVLDGKRPIFFTRNTGREFFQFYLTAGLIRLTGLPNSHLALKVGTALFGVVAVPFTFLLGRLLYGKLAGLVAAFFLSVSHWHVAITRVGLRFPFTAAFATPVLYYLLRALQTNRRNAWLLAAGFLGIGLHTYTAMRIVPVLCLVLVGLKVLWDGLRKLLRKPVLGVDSWRMSFWKNGFVAASFTSLLLLPLIRYSVEDPRGVWIRSLSRAQSNDPTGALDLGVQFVKNVGNALLMFNVRGDVVPMNTIPGEPALGLVSGALFVLGLAFLAWRLFTAADGRSVVVLVSLALLILPSILSLAFPQENPSFVRTGGAVPIVMLVAALPLATVGARFSAGDVPFGRFLMAAILGVLAVVALATNYQWYFQDYDAHIRYSIWNTTEMGAVLAGFENSGGSLDDAYHVPYPHWVDTRNIGINAGAVRWDNTVNDLLQLEEHVVAPRPRLYLLHPDDQETLQHLRNLFPSGITSRYDSLRVGKDFIVFRVP